jgi:hypothetical protein
MPCNQARIGGTGRQDGAFADLILLASSILTQGSPDASRLDGCGARQPRRTAWHREARTRADAVIGVLGQGEILMLWLRILAS